MKHLFFLLLGGYLLVSFAACKQHRPYDGQLAHIDSLADVNPDSADVLLISTTNFSLKGGKNEVALLLRIKVDDKLYRPVTHYRDTILQLVSYFEQHPKVLPSVLGSTGPALPYLYAGRIFADLGDAPQALDYYQRALDVQPARQMENGKMRIENEDARRLAKQRGLLNGFVGTMFSYQDLYAEAISSFQEANRWARVAHDTIDVIFNLRDIGIQYKYLNLNDSSLLYYQRALEYAQIAHDTNMCNDVMAQMASLYNKEGKYNLAKKYIAPSMALIDSASISGVYSIASETYLKLGFVDSAAVLFEGLLKHGNLYGKSYAYQELAELSLRKSDIKNAWRHIKQYKLLDDSIRKMDNAETVARMHAAYNYQKHKQKAVELELKNVRMKQKTTWLSLGLFLLVVIICIGFFFVRYRHRKMKARISQLQKVKQKLKLESEESCKEKELRIKELTKKLQEAIQDRNQSQEELQTEFLRLESEKRELEYQLYKQSLKKEGDRSSLEQIRQQPICKTLAAISKSQERYVHLEEWAELSRVVDSYFPDFENKINSLWHLTDQQNRLCLLRRIGFNATAIGSLVGYRESSVYSNFSRLYEKVTGQAGTQDDFDALLASL